MGDDLILVVMMISVVRLFLWKIFCFFGDDVLGEAFWREDDGAGCGRSP